MANGNITVDVRNLEVVKAEIEYLQKQVALLHEGMIRIKLSKLTGDVAKTVADTYLDQYRTNEYNKRCEEEGVDNA